MSWSSQEPIPIEPTSLEVSGVDGERHPTECLQRAGRWIRDHALVAELRPDSASPVRGDEVGEMSLVHGLMTIGHAWVEITRPDGTELVYDGAAGKFYAKASYYEWLQASPQSRYTPAEAIEMMLRTGHDGPWSLATESLDLRNASPSKGAPR